MIQDPKNNPVKPEVVPVYFSQMAVKIKDSVASPETGWVYMAFAYDATANGATAWDKAVPVGAMWGNDPQFAHTPSGTNPNGPLLETWVNPAAPAYTRQTLGWGDRLAGPMDVATRHNVVTVSGVRTQGTKEFAASSCLSCHSAAQFPFTENLYPSPNKVFPEDGTQFLMYDPGSDGLGAVVREPTGHRGALRRRSNRHRGARLRHASDLFARRLQRGGRSQPARAASGPRALIVFFEQRSGGAEEKGRQGGKGAGEKGSRGSRGKAWNPCLSLSPSPPCRPHGESAG